MKDDKELDGPCLVLQPHNPPEPSNRSLVRLEWFELVNLPTELDLLYAAGPLRILVAHNVPRERTGGMSRIMGFIHDEIVARGNAAVEYFCSDSVRRPYSKLARFTFPMAVLAHAERARRQGNPYDIVNVHEPSGAAATWWKRRTGAKVVVTSHGLESKGWRRAVEAGSVSRKSRIVFPSTVLWQAKMALQHADHIFCLNLEDRDALAADGIPKDRITRIFPGADSVFGECPRDYQRMRTFLFAATWQTRKGIRDLVSAFTRLATADPELRLIVLNPGVPADRVLGEFTPAVQRQIVYKTARPEAGIANVFAESDAFILPSLFEGTPLTMVEAMWSGLPIIATDTCGMRDVLRHGENGLLVPMGDPLQLERQMRELAVDRNLRERLGSAARREGRSSYTWTKAAEPVWQVYRKIAGCIPVQGGARATANTP